MDICLLFPPYQEITDRAKRSDEENDQPPCELAPAHLAWIAPNEIDEGNKYQDELKNGEREQEGKPRTQGNSARIFYEEQEGKRHGCISFFRLYTMRKSCLTSKLASHGRHRAVCCLFSSGKIPIGIFLCLSSSGKDGVQRIQQVSSNS
jgi:hypothetical protein